MSIENEEVYGKWIINWRKWKKYWCDDYEPVVLFHIKFICKNKTFTFNEYAEMSSFFNCIGKTSIDRKGIININSKVLSNHFFSVELVKHNEEYMDNFGIVTFKLHMFTRKQILTIVKIIEQLGYGVIHNNGIVVSCEYEINCNSSRLPYRDDPIYDCIII